MSELCYLCQIASGWYSQSSYSSDRCKVNIFFLKSTQSNQMPLKIPAKITQLIYKNCIKIIYEENLRSLRQPIRINNRILFAYRKKIIL
jgi:hypothetical protein